MSFLISTAFIGSFLSRSRHRAPDGSGRSGFGGARPRRPRRPRRRSWTPSVHTAWRSERIPAGERRSTGLPRAGYIGCKGRTGAGHGLRRVPAAGGGRPRPRVAEVPPPERPEGRVRADGGARPPGPLRLPPHGPLRPRGGPGPARPHTRDGDPVPPGAGPVGRPLRAGGAGTGRRAGRVPGVERGLLRRGGALHVLPPLDRPARRAPPGHGTPDPRHGHRPPVAPAGGGGDLRGGFPAGGSGRSPGARVHPGGPPLEGPRRGAGPGDLLPAQPARGPASGWSGPGPVPLPGLHLLPRRAPRSGGAPPPRRPAPGGRPLHRPEGGADSPDLERFEPWPHVPGVFRRRG